MRLFGLIVVGLGLIVSLIIGLAILNDQMRLAKFDAQFDLMHSQLLISPNAVVAESRSVAPSIGSADDCIFISSRTYQASALNAETLAAIEKYHFNDIKPRADKTLPQAHIRSLDGMVKVTFEGGPWDNLLDLRCL